MKNLIFISSVLLLSFTTLLKAQTASLPNFKFYTAGNKEFTKTSLKPNTPVIVVYFDPDCDHCNKQAGIIRDGIAKFSDIQMIWVAFPASAEDITAFGRKYFAAQFGKNIHFMRDNDYTFDQAFGYSEAPTIHVYNKLGKLTKSFKKKEASVEELLAATK
jgi:peroxiredoxin